MKILIIGLGSIGKRHLDNLLSLGYNQIVLVTRKALLPKPYNGFQVFKQLLDALENSSYDAAFICSPTSLHLQQLLLLLQHKVKYIYVEKPLSHSVQHLEEVMQLTASYKNNVVVGYDLHFDPAIEKTKELIQQKIIGEIISVNAFVGQHLSQWRPTEDYREGMSAKKKSGGGVLLDLIHEFDYLNWLLGDIDSVACNYINSGSLQIETEESADVLLKFSNGAIGTVHLDYLQPSLIRNCIFTGSEGTIILNLANKNVTLTKANNETEYFDYCSYERNDRFITIVKSFLENAKDKRLTNLNQAVKSLQVVLAAKYSSENNCFVNMKNFNSKN